MFKRLCVVGLAALLTFTGAGIAGEKLSKKSLTLGENVYADVLPSAGEEGEGEEDETPSPEFSIVNLMVNPDGDQVKVSFDFLCANDFADNYSIDYSISRSEDGEEYEIISANSSYYISTGLTYYDYDVIPGKSYYYKVTISGFSTYGYYVSYTEENMISLATMTPVTIMAVTDVPVLKAVSHTQHNIKLTWERIYSYKYSVKQYKIYRSTEYAGTYSLIKTVNDDWSKSSFSYIDKNLTFGTRYYYKMTVVYAKANGQTFESVFSPIVNAVSTIEKATFKSMASKKANTITVKWNKVADAEGYYVFVKAPGKEYKKVKTVKGNTKNVNTYTIKKLTNGTKYYIRIQAYKHYNGHSLTNNATKIKYCDYYGHENESYYDALKRIYGKKKEVRYKSDASARKHMTSFKIKVWDQTASGKWFTRYFTISMHKKIAPTVKAMFAELYALPAKYRRPIHDIGGYSWRGSGSTSYHPQGLALDINANENYQVRDGKALCGSFWKPKKNRYSIPLNCKFTKILLKYGFRRCVGYDSSYADYMHFSYNQGW